MHLGAEKLDQLIRNEETVYVVNRTKGILVVTFPNGNTTERVVLPKTGHPFNLSARVPSEAIRGSMELRRFLTRNVVDLVSPKAAETILDDPEVKEELQEATERTFNHGKGATSANPDGVSSSPDAVEALKKVANLLQAKTDSTTSRNEVVAEDEEDDAQPHIRARVTMQRVASGELKVRAALIDLKAIATDLTENDLSYILSQAPVGLLSNWAKKKLDKLQSPQQEDIVVPD